MFEVLFFFYVISQASKAPLCIPEAHNHKVKYQKKKYSL